MTREYNDLACWIWNKKNVIIIVNKLYVLKVFQMLLDLVKLYLNYYAMPESRKELTWIDNFVIFDSIIGLKYFRFEGRFDTNIAWVTSYKANITKADLNILSNIKFKFDMTFDV